MCHQLIYSIGFVFVSDGCSLRYGKENLSLWITSFLVLRAAKPRGLLEKEAVSKYFEMAFFVSAKKSGKP